MTTQQIDQHNLCGSQNWCKFTWLIQKLNKAVMRQCIRAMPASVWCTACGTICLPPLPEWHGAFSHQLTACSALSSLNLIWQPGTLGFISKYQFELLQQMMHVKNTGHCAVIVNKSGRTRNVHVWMLPVDALILLSVLSALLVPSNYMMQGCCHIIVGAQLIL
jgi:hypothetical protein